MNKAIVLKTLFISSIISLQMPVQAEEVEKANKVEAVKVVEKADKTSVKVVEANKEKPVKEKKGFLQKFDANKDGKVSKKEFKTYMGKRFQRMDVDESGTVSTDELRLHAMKQQNKGVRKKIVKHDSDGDGTLSKEEFLAPKIKQAEAKFAELDIDKDGKLSAYEISGSKKNKKADKPKAPELFPNIDADKNGKISDEEKNAAFERLFGRLDQNKDQIVTQEEVKAGRNKPSK
ncbi:MAG: hypothetical protein GQ569_00155 [Methylococcaceae bacterium]|nr:hypothetical protein [Methylococcaceae bacterium]